jgi:uncharacterized protein YciI
MNLSLFVVHLAYRNLDQLPTHHAEHAEWVERYASAGTFLLAGPTAKGDGGVILAQAASRDELDAILLEDAFFRAGLVSHDIVEFAPRRGALRRRKENPLHLSEEDLERALNAPAF